VAAVLLLIIMNLPTPLSHWLKAGVREGLAPLQELVAGTRLRLTEALAALRGLGGLSRQHREMSAELIRLRGKLAEREAIERENYALRTQLDFRRRSPLDLIACEVIGRDASGWWETVRIGKGRADGILPDTAVLTPEGLVGRSIDVSPRTADVLLISDPRCRVAARIARTGMFGVVRGLGANWQGQALCRMDFININTPVRPGDEVITSGLGGIYPRGLVIGYVENVVRDESGLYQSADVLPRADLGKLVYVFAVGHGEVSIEDLLLERREAAGGGP